MEPAALLSRALDAFAGSYDIARDAQVLSRRVDALAQLRALNSKYVLSQKHVLWEANAFEHAIFLCVDTLTAEMVEDWFAFLTLQAEPELVHPGKSLPDEGHMYTYLTLIFLCNGVHKDALQAIRRARFTKNYRFSLRGWATGRLLAVDLSSGVMTANAAGRELKPLFARLLREA